MAIIEEMLEVIEEYELLGEKRYRLRIKGTNVIINVHADSSEEAVKKAVRILQEMGLLEEVKQLQSSRDKQVA